MKNEAPSLFFERKIKAPVKDVYRAFTNEATITEWMCNAAQVDANLKTRLYFWWNTGYYTCGEFTKVVPNKEVVFTWLGKNDPGKTRVRVTFKQEVSHTHLTIEHRGIKNSARWAAALQQIQRGWEVALENLVSIMETGRDLRIINQPMMGVNLDEFTPEIAARLKIPASQGVRLSGVIDGMGAQKCGLMKDDVLVEGEGMPIVGYSSLAAILQGRKAGEKITIDFYRGPAKKSVVMELSPRPVPVVPSSCAELVQAVEEIYAQGDRTLEEALQGVTDQEATFRPGPEEWNVYEVLAHLIHTERDLQVAIHKWVLNENFISPNNLRARLEATIAVHPTLADLRAELRRSEAETLAFLRSLPEEFSIRKDSFWYMAFTLLQSNYHPLEHAKQIQAAVADARKR
jgi:uncharacterized protein YndB with AHSA1/START domain